MSPAVRFTSRIYKVFETVILAPESPKGDTHVNATRVERGSLNGYSLVKESPTTMNSLLFNQRPFKVRPN